MKKFLLSCAVLLSAVSFTVYAAQENSKDKKDKRDKMLLQRLHMQGLYVQDGLLGMCRMP